MRSEADTQPVEKHVMFVYSFAYIDCPFEAVEPTVLEVLHSADQVAEGAYREAEHIRSRVKLAAADGRLAKTIQMEVGEPSRGITETTVPIMWTATGTPALFPVLRGEFVVASVGAATQLALRGSYEPPLGALGRALDRIMLHRIAEASVKSFVDRIGAMVRHPCTGNREP